MNEDKLFAKLNSIEQALSLISPKNPFYVDAAVTGRNFRQLVIQENTVLTVVTGSNGTDYLTTWGISGKTLKQGAILSCRGGEVITAVTPSSGSLIGYE